MYGKKAIYFNYKSYGGFIAFIFIPALLVLMGGSMAYMFLAWQPIFIGVLAAVLLAMPGYPRFMAINANVALKLDKNKKALKKMRVAAKLPFATLSVHIFHAYVELINGHVKEASDILDRMQMEKLSYSEKAKWDATKALCLWLDSGNPDEALKYLEDKDRKGADESILYVKGKLLNLTGETSEARKYNETAIETNQENRDILSNMVISYCRTTQDKDAKIMFRTLYHDMKATSDALYYMATIKEKENKNLDAVDFIKKALEIERSSVDLITEDGLHSYKDKLEAAVNEI